jgi:aerobic-type carbon monoxide dehydrogenase small subunit (CoxS/CutS family)
MPKTISIRVNGVPMSVPANSTVAAALLAAGMTAIRRSVTGMPRGPLCGMGICFECRVKVDGVEHVKSCQTICHPDMEVEVDEF